MQAAMCGLEPSSVLGQCYPVPFRNSKTNQRECQFIIGYRGMASIARRSGEVLSIDAQIVHEKDEFELIYGIEQSLTHKPNLDGDSGAVRGAYCVVRFKDGSYQFRYMPKSEIDAHRRRSKAASSGPWVTDYEEMAKKSVFRSLFKWLPISLEMITAASGDGSVGRYNALSTTPDEGLEIEYVVAQDESGAAEGDKGADST
jgi:recombination protein RecT